MKAIRRMKLMKDWDMKIRTIKRWGNFGSIGMASFLAIVAISPIGATQEDANFSSEQNQTIPAGPLGSALLAINEVFDVAVIASEDVVEGKSAPAIAGAATAEEALSIALTGSGLEVSRSPNGAFIVSLPAERTEKAAIAQPTVQSESDEARIEDVIIVRGQRFEQTEFEAATSVAVTTEDEIRTYPSANDVDDILERLPNVVSVGVDSGGAVIRGINSTGALQGQFAFSGGARPRVTSSLDGYALSFNEYTNGATSIYDIDQVEIYRGPQTTTQGANAIAGAIYVFTKDPIFEFEAGGLVEVGNFDTLQTAGYVSGPIIEDQLAGRITVDRRERNSFLDVSTNDPSSVDFNKFDNLNIRGKLLFQPEAVPGFEAKLSVSHNDNFNLRNELAQSPFRDRNARPFLDSADVVATSGTLDTSYQVSSDVELRNQFTLSDYSFDIVDGSDPTAPFVFADTDGNRITNETLISFDPDSSALAGIAGVYYVHQEQTDILFFVGPEETEDTQDSLGIFAQATFDLTDRLEMTGGLRYQYDRQERQGVFVFVPIDFTESFDAFLPKIALAYDVSNSTRIGVSVARGFNPGGATVDLDNGITNVFDAETVWTFDAFVRSRLFDDQLKLTGNVFYSDFEDYQRFTLTGFNPQTLEPIFQVGNVPEAEAYGVEISVEYDITPEITVFASGGLLEANFSELVAEGIFDTFDFSRAPSVTAFIGINARPLENLTLSSQMRYSDGYFSEDDNLPENVIDSYAVFDLSARYDFERFSLYGYVENVGDNFYETSVFTLFDGTQQGNLGAPQRYGVGIEVSF